MSLPLPSFIARCANTFPLVHTGRGLMASPTIS